MCRGTSQRNPDADKSVTVFAAVLGTAGQPSHALTWILGGRHPQYSSALGREMVVCSELCIDKGRHRSAFHNSVNNVHINRKKQKQVVKDQKRENVLITL